MLSISTVAAAVSYLDLFDIPSRTAITLPYVFDII